MASSNLQSKILHRMTTPEEYRVYRAGLEWDLTDPIVLDKREDIKSECLWHDRLEPYNHQVTNLITFCRRLPVTLIADDVGLGKTISAGLIMSELMSRSRLSNTLIVCPKLLGPQWKEELLVKFNIPSKIVTGQDLVNIAPEENGAIITTYQTARLHLDSIPHDRFQMLVLDEAHKLRNLYGVKNPPQVAKCFRKVLEERRYRFVLMLTATPIQNRLWDLYSLVDLLTVARGHQNPFGNEGMFARKFIADGRENARQLKPEARNEFRSIIYGYMSRIRRSDAKLYFPNRVVHMHKVKPTMAELQLIDTIAKPIQKLNKLAQISILQALVSSPDALMAQLNKMAKNGSVPEDIAATVRTIVTGMPTSAKLQGLGELINRLKCENPEQWRLVVFTGRIETQTTIQSFLEEHGFKVGIINGTSGSRNQDTIRNFRMNPPNCRIIISTEAGSEGINLQVANILVNYDLPWNPMIVEQRIGRIQRLASEHANVAIFNIILRDTFEEYIVGRLMEKLQMASQAIGDIEALLEAAGIDGDDGDVSSSFDEKIRQLVIAALAGKDIESATRQTELSIAEAKITIKREEAHLNEMLGGIEGAGYVGPRTPKLPSALRSMTPRNFVLNAFESFGAHVTSKSADLYIVEENRRKEYICFDDNVELGIKSTSHTHTGSASKARPNPWSTEIQSTLYAPGTSAFLQLVGRVIATGTHAVEDIDISPALESEEIIRQWVSNFGGIPQSSEISTVHRCFNGVAIVRVRVSVAHDSYERLIEVHCTQAEHHAETGRAGLSPLSDIIENPSSIGINVHSLVEAIKLDKAISEFSRFYVERRSQEVFAAIGDERKKKKLEDEFTPRIEMALVALEGKLHRQLRMTVKYTIDNEHLYQSTISIIPHTGKIIDGPEMGHCTRSGKTVPRMCLKECQITGKLVLQHLLIKSAISARFALPEYAVLCSQSGNLIFQDEAQVSDVSGLLVTRTLLKTSALSGRKAESKYFVRCEFSKTEVLNSELAISEVSSKRYRIDEQMRSDVSGKTGHKQEFIICQETGKTLSVAESEQCEITGKYVQIGILESCAITQKRVLPSELLQCAVTGKKALKRLLVTSSLSEARMLEEVAIRSATGKFCTPVETKLCLWSGQKYHPDDLRICELTGLSVHFEFVSASSSPHLQPLDDLLNGIKRTKDEYQLWDTIMTEVTHILGKGRYKVEAANLSPDKQCIAICFEVSVWLGFRIHQVGLIYSISDHTVIGRVANGRRTSKGWSKG